MAIETPFELLDLQDGQSLSFRVRQWEVGTATIKPAHAPEGKLVRVVRLYVPAEDKASYPPWWDVTAATAVAQLVPILTAPGLASKTFTFTARGFGAKKRYTLDVRMAG